MILLVGAGLVLADVLVYLVLRIWRHGPRSSARGAAQWAHVVVLGCGTQIALAAVLRGTVVVVRALLAGRRAGRWVAERATAPGARLRAVLPAVRAGVEVVQLDVCGPVAVTHRLFSPRVAISTGLVERTTEEELRAVVQHELHHARRRHPLGRLAVDAVAGALWFVPALRTVAVHVKTRQELAADQAALRVVTPGVVASALVKSLAPDGPEAGGARLVRAGTAMGGETALEARVRQLEGGPRGFGRRLRCCSLRRSLVLVVVLAGVWVYCGVTAAAGLCEGSF
ncbi:M56 family metallopeptidase [Kitasatospora sp. NPDC056327]|uniref:M56 family metallopeptidase n=1 Tax=Kitasatospora sp. NPDC056327 TaxID=3345785 RepID=UPI0035E2304C